MSAPLDEQVRTDAKVNDLKITDRELRELFRCIDGGDRTDQMISQEEFRVFLGAKKDMKRLPISGKVAAKSGTVVTQAPKKEASSAGAAFVVEYMCVKSTAIRESQEMDSPVRPLGFNPHDLAPRMCPAWFRSADCLGCWLLRVAIRLPRQRRGSSGGGHESRQASAAYHPVEVERGTGCRMGLAADG